jgi:N6-L-threonylcarbamoyladenine synthase
MLDRPGLAFSFSGLKTAALVALRASAADPEVRADVARGFEEAVVDTLGEKTRRALIATGHRRLVVAGGVGANRRLRERLAEVAAECEAALYFPRTEFCTDNGAMIALAGCLRMGADGMPAEERTTADLRLGARANWPLDDKLQQG